MKIGILILSLILNCILIFSSFERDKSQPDQCDENLKFSELQNCQSLQTLKLELKQLREKKLTRVKEADANFSYMYNLEALQTKSDENFDKYAESECALRLIMGIDNQKFTCEIDFFKALVANLKSEAKAEDQNCHQLSDRSQVLTCLTSKYQKLNDALLAIEKGAFAQAKENDLIAPLYENKKVLKLSSERFKAYRDAECLRRNAYTLSGGLAGRLAEISCEIEITKGRIAELNKKDKK